MENKNLEKNIELIKLSQHIITIGNRAIKTIRKENKKKGIPLVYSIDGKILYELPDGRVTRYCNLTK